MSVSKWTVAVGLSLTLSVLQSTYPGLSGSIASYTTILRPSAPPNSMPHFDPTAAFCIFGFKSHAAARSLCCAPWLPPDGCYSSPMRQPSITPNCGTCRNLWNPLRSALLT
ncbi:uncharacterized protein ColSpa_11423 [Colletotrichum spaethianum]|uniref:Secreted protein n=1 Tax=Colletotrichum spaethianum TaxID=700344 RepID=A0AA37URQ7_9PEZI|nr:uncharacterized protein ColSpa_11423 [Colletotrichum spaethianum]GKT51242.1 hypothetical protein ColSpa_11423 [Colletotrichum spaethianum]